MATTKENIIVLPSGAKALNCLPETQGPAAMVNLATLKRFIATIPTKRTEDVKKDFVTRVETAYGMSQFLDIIAEELSFHRTIQMVEEAKLEDFEEKKLTATPQI